MTPIKYFYYILCVLPHSKKKESVISRDGKMYERIWNDRISSSSVAASYADVVTLIEGTYLSHIR